MRAITVNEFTAPRWDVPYGAGGQTLGQAVLAANGFEHPHWWVGASIGVLAAYTFLVNVVVILALRFLSGAA